MNATQDKAKILAIERRKEELRAEINRLETRRTGLLRDLPVEPIGYEAAKLTGFLEQVEADLEAARGELRRLEDQVAVLRDGLPSDAEVAEADARVTTLLETATDYETQFRIAWHSLLDAMAEAAEAAREAIAYRNRQRSAVQEAASLVAQWGIEGREDLPPVHHRNGPARLAGAPAEVELLCGLLDVARSAADDSLEPDGAAVSRVADARARLRRIEAAAA